MKSHEYYRAVLGVTSTATPEELKQAYRDLVKVWHPDRFTDDPSLQSKAEAKLKEINEAYDQLQGLITDKTTATPQPQPQPKTAEQPEKHPDPTRGASHENRFQSKKHPYWVRISRRGGSRISQKRRVLLGLGLFLGLIIASKFFDSDPETRERINSANPPFYFEVPASPPEHSRSKDTAERRILSADIVKTMKESYDGALRLLALHEAEKKRVHEEYLRRRELYSQGLVSRAEVSQAESALATAIAKIDADKRWLTQAEIAIAEAAAATERLNRTK